MPSSTSSRSRSTRPTNRSNRFLVDPPDIVKKKAAKQAPQQTIDEFWAKFTTKHPGKAFTVLPDNFYAQRVEKNTPKGVIKGENAVASFDEAVETCKKKVQKISQECRRVNQKYRDPHFDIEFDLKWGRRNCLDGLTQRNPNLVPESAKRVGDIFDNPHFYIDGATASDVRQGYDGDCWFLSALCALSNKEELISRICVERDEAVGVYGFVFHRDGEWISTIIDDKLYLTKRDYDESDLERMQWNDIMNRQDPEEEYRKAYQTGSRALYFAQCSTENETWLPLLEKAYAKAHGDFGSIEGGFTGEGIEDLTGGVTTELFATDILDKEKFWQELLNVNKEFLFGCATGMFRNWGSWGSRKGVVEGHAYSIMEAREVKGEKLLRLRNPWGKSEWTGAWSDGSEQWTAEWMELLGHKFGNDGVFWISYQDLLRKYQSFDRTRLFGPEWTVTQQWTSLGVPWTVDYHDTKFQLHLSKQSPVVIVLSQLDDRYFNGLEGQYSFELQFRVHREGEEDYVVRSHANYLMDRSVSAELDLEAGSYSVLLKVTADRDPNDDTPEEVIRKTCRYRRDKLLQIGLSYDLAHAKGHFVESDREKHAREEREKKKKEAAKEKRKTAFKENRARMKAARKRDALRKKAERTKLQDKRAAKEAEKKKSKEATAAKDDVGRLEEGVPLANNVEEKQEGPTEEAKETDASEEPIAGDITDSKPAEDGAVGEKTADEKNDVGVEGEGKKGDDADWIDKKEEEEGKAEDSASKALPSPPPSDGLPEENTPATTASDDADDISDISSVSSVSSIADDDSADFSDFEYRRTRSTTSSVASNDSFESDHGSVDEEFESDPWNAVCVVGLRVYSKDTEVSVEIVRPKMEEGEAGLDNDDAAKDASGEGVPVVIEEDKLDEMVKTEGSTVEKDGKKSDLVKKSDIRSSKTPSPEGKIRPDRKC
ncbi:MAG: hypothetical protein M1812_003873 [Candelaria pacifica]|nr:MAG: hypothetical protein M1812_003873 [Candelaria pacifica]